MLFRGVLALDTRCCSFVENLGTGDTGGRGALTKVLRVLGVALGLAYAYWNLHHEYSLKYLYAGSLDMAVWRSLNASAAQAADLSRLTDAELSIGRDPPACPHSLADIAFPASCDFFAGNFGGKSRNCRYWWLGRKCYVFYVPEEVYERPALREPVMRALQRPCDVLFDPDTRTDVAQTDAFLQRARNAFGCNGSLLPIDQEVKLYVIGRGGQFETQHITMSQ